MSDTDHLDALMERASVALVGMDYLTCEDLCLEALAQARAEERWAYYARVLLPLQEARRHRRMIAAEGVVRLGSTSLDLADPQLAAKEASPGCLVLTHPHTVADAATLVAHAREQHLFLEVLFCDNTTSDETWRVTSHDGSPVAVSLPAPPPAWRDRPLAWDQPPPPTARKTPSRPADWVIDAGEALGDAALSQVAGITAPAQRLVALEACLLTAPDHELILQHLGATVRAMPASSQEKVG